MMGIGWAQVTGSHSQSAVCRMTHHPVMCPLSPYAPLPNAVPPYAPLPSGLVTFHPCHTSHALLQPLQVDDARPAAHTTFFNFRALMQVGIRLPFSREGSDTNYNDT